MRHKWGQVNDANKESAAKELAKHAILRVEEQLDAIPKVVFNHD